jgi:phosphatidylinositol alpha-mannosyltransferase
VLLGRSRSVVINRSVAPVSLSPRVAATLREVAAEVDVLHVHEPLVPAVGHAALRSARGPVVATFHADPSRLVRTAYRWGRIVGRRLLARATLTTAVSAVAASAVRPFAQCRIVPNGIDVTDYETGDKIPGRVVFLGRDDRRKGLDVLLAAWPAVRTAIPDATLHVVGADRGTEIEGVVWRGRLDEASKRAELTGAEILAAPNLGGESFGIVLLEGLASGCVVVASALPAFTEVLGGAGVLTAAGDVEGLGDAITDLLADRERLRNIGAEGPARAQRFDGSLVAEAYAAVYREALAT